MLALFRFKSLIFGLSLILLGGILACGEGATPTPDAQPTQDVAAIVQQVLAQQEQPDVLTAADIQQLVQGVVTQALADQPAPEGLTAQQVQDLVQNAIAATIQPGASALEVQTAIAAAVGAIEPGISAEDVQVVVQQAVTRALAALPTPTSMAMMEPSGTLDFGDAEFGTSIWAQRNQPYNATTWENLTIQEHMFTFTNAPANEVELRLLEDFSSAIDSDGNWVYTFKVRRGVPFHTRFGLWGEVTADDMIFSVEEVAGSTVHARSGDMRRTYQCDGCVLAKVDDFTFTLTSPKPTFNIPRVSINPTGGRVGIHSKKHFDAVGEETANVQAVGTGPWELVEDKTDVFRRVKAVRNHWRKTPEWDQMVWWIIAEESTRLANFEVGLLDIANLTTESLQAIKNLNDPDIKFMRVPGATAHELLLTGQQYFTDAPSHVGDDPRVPLGDNPYDCSLAWVSCNRELDSEDWANARKVRLAMNIAIDREALVNNLSRGDGTATHLMKSVGYDERVKQFGLDQLKYEFDPDRARQLLVEAGFADGFEIDAFLIPLGGAKALPPIQAVAGMWRDIGLTVNENPTPYAPFRPTLVNRTAKGVISWSFGGPSFEPLLSFNLSTTGLSINTGFEHPFFQDLVDRAFAEQDTEERWKLDAAMIRFWHEEAIGFPLFSEPVIFPLGPELDSWTRAGTGGQIWYSNWEFAPHRQ